MSIRRREHSPSARGTTQLLNDAGLVEPEGRMQSANGFSGLPWSLCSQAFSPFVLVYFLSLCFSLFFFRERVCSSLSVATLLLFALFHFVRASSLSVCSSLLLSICSSFGFATLFFLALYQSGIARFSLFVFLRRSCFALLFRFFFSFLPMDACIDGAQTLPVTRTSVAPPIH
jgi:hypothetical protein